MDKGNTEDTAMQITQRKAIDYSWNFERADTKYCTHGIFKYPAMMVAPIVKRLMDKYSAPGCVILDPFCGSGSVLVEAVLHDCESYGIDINPLALLLAKVKTTPINSQLLIEEYQKFIEFRDKNPESIEIPSFFHIDYWFKPNVIKNLAVIKAWLNEIEDEDVKDFFKISFAETVRTTSNTRNGEFKLYRLPKKKLDTYNPNVFVEFGRVANHNIKKMRDLFRKCPPNPKKPHIFYEDTRTKTSVPKNSVDLIITSPPYGDSKTTVAYGQFSRLSLQWLGLSKKEVTDIDKISLGGIPIDDSEIKQRSHSLDLAIDKIAKMNDKRIKDVLSFYTDLDRCFEEIDRITRAGSTFCIVVGNRTVKGVQMPTDEIISELLHHHGFEHEQTIIRKIPNKVMPSQNSPTNEPGKLSPTMTEEYIVIMEKFNQISL